LVTPQAGTRRKEKKTSLSFGEHNTARQLEKTWPREKVRMRRKFLVGEGEKGISVCHEMRVWVCILFDAKVQVGKEWVSKSRDFLMTGREGKKETCPVPHDSEHRRNSREH